MNNFKWLLTCTFLVLTTSSFGQPTASVTAGNPFGPALVNLTPTTSGEAARIITPEHFTAIATVRSQNYQIIVDGKSSFVQVQGDPTTINSVKCNVDDKGVLQCSYPFSCHVPPQITIHAAYLNHLIQSGASNVSANFLIPQTLQLDKSGTGNLSITGPVTLVGFNYSGTGSINIPQFKTTHLILNVTTPLTIKFTGVINASKINFWGSGSLQVYWVNSDVLNVTSNDSGTLALAGVAHVVNAYANQASHLDLRYLRSKSMFVKSYGDSSVDVWAQQNLFSLARNNSNIYYYTEPGYKSRMMQESGTVLPMWNIPGAILDFNTRGSIAN